MRTLWICLSVALIIAFVEAQKNLNSAKPVVALKKQSGPPIWRRAPEERKKLPLFPKNSKKFVVTDKTTPRTEVTKPMVATKRPMLRKLFVKDNIDKKTWTFPPPPETTMKPKHFNTPVTPQPKRDYNRSYKAKAQPSSIKSVATSVKAEPPTNKAKLNRGNLIQVLNKINAYTDKASTNKAKKVIQNNNPVKAKSPFKLFKKPTYGNAGSVKENTPAPMLNEKVEKVLEEKVFVNKPMDYYMQDNKPLNVSSLNTMPKEYEDDNDYVTKEANMTKKTDDELLNKANEKALLSNQVANVTQNNKPLNASSLNIVSEEYVDDNDYENSEANMTKKTNNEQLNKTVEKALLSQQVDNNKSLNVSSIDVLSKEYVGEIESFENNVTKATTEKQQNKTAEKISSSKQVNNVTQNDKSLNVSSPDIIDEEYVDAIDYEISKSNVTKATTNELLNKTAEKISSSEQVDKVIQNDKILNAITLDTVSEEHVEENYYDNSETNLTKTTANDQLNETAEKISLNMQVNTQNDKSLKASSLDIVTEKYIDKNDYERGEVNVTKSIADEQLNRTAEKISLSKQVDDVIQNDKFFHASLLDVVTKKYVHENYYESREANESKTITDEQLNKTADKIPLSKQVDDVIQNNKLFNASLPDTVLEEYVHENVYENSESNLTQTTSTTVNEEINKTAENISLSMQVDNVIQNNKSLNDSLPDTVLEAFINENNYERTEPNLIQITVNEEINKIAVEVFSSKQTNNISQNNDSLKVNISDDYVVNESDSRASNATPTELIYYEENESTAIYTTFTEEPFRHNEPLEGKTLKNTDLDDQNDFSISKLNDMQSSDDESGDLLKLEELETLMKEISKSTNSYKDHELPVNSNDAKSFSPLQDINKENLKIQPQKFEEISKNYYEVEPIDFDNENKISTQIEVTEKYDDGNNIIETDLTNTESNRSNTNNMNGLENSAEVIKGNTISSESKENITVSQLSMIVSNSVVENSDKSDTISPEHEQTSPVPYTYERLPKSPIEAAFDNLQMLSDCLTKSPIEIAFDNLKTLSVEEKSEEPVFSTTESIIIDQNTENPITENLIFLNNYSVTTISENNEDEDTDMFSAIINLNIEENVNHNNENGSIVDNLRDLAEIMKDKSTNFNGSEEAISVTQLMDLDINIVEEHSHVPNEITTELDETTQAFHSNEIPIEIVFNSQEALITEKNSTKPAFKENVHKIIDQSLIHGLSKRDEIITMVNDPTTEISINLEDATTNVASPVEILDMERSSSESNENSAVIITLPNLDEVFSENLSVGDDIEVITSKTDSLNGHLSYGLSKRDEIITMVNDPTTENSINIEDATTNAAGPVEILDMERSSSENNENSTIVITLPNLDEFLSDNLIVSDDIEVITSETDYLNSHTSYGLSKRAEIITMVHDPTAEISINIEDATTNVASPGEILDMERSSSENNENSTIVITLPNLDEVLSNNLIVSDDIEVITSETDSLNSHINITNEDMDKPHAVAVAFEGNLNTKQDYVGSERETASSTRKLCKDHEPHSMDLSFDVHTNKITDEPVTEQFNLTEKITIRLVESLSISPKAEDTISQTDSPNLVDDNSYSDHDMDLSFDVYTNKVTDEPVTEKFNLTEKITIRLVESLSISPKAEDTISQTDSPNLVDENSNSDHTSKVDIPASQLITLHINIAEENSNKPSMITIVLDGTTQKTYLKGEHLDHAPVDIFSDNLEPTIPKNEDFNMPMDEIINETVTNEPSPNFEGIEITEESIKVTIKDISDELLSKRSNLPEDNLSKSNNFKAKGVLSESNIASEEISNEEIMDNSINSSNEFSHESLIVTKGSSNSLEEMFEIMIAQADHSKYEGDENSNESYVLDDSSSSLVTQEDISDGMKADHKKILTDDIPNDLHDSNESITSLITTEEISDEITADKSENVTDKISNESYVVNDSSGSVMTTEEIFDDITREVSENLTDEISNELRILNDSSSTEVIIQDIFDDADEKSKSFTYKVSNVSHFEVIHASDEKSEEFEQSVNIDLGEDASNDYDIDVRHPNTELAPNDMLVSRNKRSNNIIEEENLGTTLSSFKYTGHGSRLGHDPSYKNINA